MVVVEGKGIYVLKNGTQYCFCTISLHDGESTREKCPFIGNQPLKILNEKYQL